MKQLAILITGSTYGNFQLSYRISSKILFAFRTFQMHKFARNQEMSHHENKALCCGAISLLGFKSNSVQLFILCLLISLSLNRQI